MSFLRFGTLLQLGKEALSEESPKSPLRGFIPLHVTEDRGEFVVEVRSVCSCSFENTIYGPGLARNGGFLVQCDVLVVLRDCIQAVSAEVFPVTRVILRNENDLLAFLATSCNVATFEPQFLLGVLPAVKFRFVDFQWLDEHLRDVFDEAGVGVSRPFLSLNWPPTWPPSLNFNLAILLGVRKRTVDRGCGVLDLLFLDNVILGSA